MENLLVLGEVHSALLFEEEDLPPVLRPSMVGFTAEPDEDESFSNDMKSRG